MQRHGDRKTKVHADINRICELEDAVPEWTLLGPKARDQPRCFIDLNRFMNRFKIVSVWFNELDQHCNKILLQTIRRGVVEPSVFGDQIIVHVKAEGEPLSNEIRKRGMIFDRNKNAQKI